MGTLRVILKTIRGPFLILSPICVLVGLGTSFIETQEISIIKTILILIGAVLAHISVNTFNEYFDYKSGLDFKTERTPFSGGSGALQNRPDLAMATLVLAIVSLCIVMSIGVFFMQTIGLGILFIAILGLLLVLTYSLYLVKLPLMCLFAPGIGFGSCMVLGTHYCLTGNLTFVAILSSLVPFFLVNNLLLFNQFPDTKPDQEMGRKHFPITLGRRNCSWILMLFFLSTYIIIVIGVYLKIFPLLSLLSLITIVLAILSSIGAFTHAENPKALEPFMGMNVVVCLVTPLILSLSFFLK